MTVEKDTLSCQWVPPMHDGKSSEFPPFNPSITSTSSVTYRGEPSPVDGSGLFHCFRRWGREIVALAFGIASMAACIGTLLALDNQDLDEWHIPVRPNSLVAIFITAAASAILRVMSGCISQLKWIYFEQQERSVADLELFDAASRGPVGSVGFLLHINRRAALCSACATVTLLCLALAPFAQQIIKYSTAPAASQLAAVLPVAHTWTPFLQVSGLVQDYEVWGQATHAIYKSFLLVESELNYVCPTGNCAWPRYHTLGLCSSCNNVTATSNATYGVRVFPSLEDTYVLDSKYVTPEGIELGSPSFLYYDSDGSGHTNGTLLTTNGPLLTTNATPPNGNTVKDVVYNFPKIAIARFLPWTKSQIPSHPHDLASLNTSNPRPVDLYECAFHYCGMTREAKVTEGKLHDSLLEVAPITIFNVSAAERRGLGYYSGHTYTLGIAAASTLSSGIFEFFASPPSRISFSIAFENEIQRLKWEPRTALWSPNDGNVTKTIAEVAEGMTVYIRESTSDKLTGTAFVSHTTMHVQWRWLSLPLATFLLATLCLGVSMAISFNRRAILWKSSPLALLFHGLSGWTREELDNIPTYGMRQKPERMRARLRRDDDGGFMLARGNGRSDSQRDNIT